MSPYLTCNDTELVLNHPLGILPTGMRRTVETWLHEHGIDPVRVAARAPIRRDPSTGVVSWTAQCPDGTRVRDVEHVDQLGWPAPFPSRIRTDISRSDTGGRSAT